MTSKDRVIRRRRRLEVGAEVIPGEGVHFRVWAPGRRSVAVVLEGGPGPTGPVPLGPAAGGYFEGLVAEAGAGTPLSLPARRRRALTRTRPRGSSPTGRTGRRGWSTPARSPGPTADWPGPSLEDAVLYEIHVGTFTPEGTWDAAAEQLPSAGEARA